MGFGSFISKTVSPIVSNTTKLIGKSGIDPTSGPLAPFSDALFGTNFYGTDKQIELGRETNEMNRKIAHDQMNFQERMSSTAYQRQVKDLQRAGINPMLAIMSSGGASSPQGASIAAQNPAQGVRVGGQGAKSITEAFSTAMAAKRIKQEVKSMEQSIKTNQALQKKASNEAKLADTEQKIRRVQQHINEKTQSSAIQAQNDENKFRSKSADYNKQFIKFDAWGSRLRQFVPFTSPRNAPNFGGSSRGGRGTYLIDKKTGEIIGNSAKMKSKFSRGR